MSQPRIDIDKIFKEVFATKNGQIVLDHLRQFCRGNFNQDISCVGSTNQTFYNLGAYAVYRHIQYQINLESAPNADDCIITEESGE